MISIICVYSKYFSKTDSSIYCDNQIWNDKIIDIPINNFTCFVNTPLIRKEFKCYNLSISSFFCYESNYESNKYSVIIYNSTNIYDKFTCNKNGNNNEYTCNNINCKKSEFISYYSCYINHGHIILHNYIVSLLVIIGLLIIIIIK